jgi:hypothetical protein
LGVRAWRKRRTSKIKITNKEDKIMKKEMMANGKTYTIDIDIVDEYEIPEEGETYRGEIANAREFILLLAQKYGDDPQYPFSPKEYLDYALERLHGDDVNFGDNQELDMSEQGQPRDVYYFDIQGKYEVEYPNGDIVIEKIENRNFGERELIDTVEEFFTFIQ